MSRASSRGRCAAAAESMTAASAAAAALARSLVPVVIEVEPVVGRAARVALEPLDVAGETLQRPGLARALRHGRSFHQLFQKHLVARCAPVQAEESDYGCADGARDQQGPEREVAPPTEKVARLDPRSAQGPVAEETHDLASPQ